MLGSDHLNEILSPEEYFSCFNKLSGGYLSLTLKINDATKLNC